MGDVRGLQYVPAAAQGMCGEIQGLSPGINPLLGVKTNTRVERNEGGETEEKGAVHMNHPDSVISTVRAKISEPSYHLTYGLLG